MHHARTRPEACPTARTPSRSARSTPPATSTRPRRRAPSRSTPVPLNTTIDSGPSGLTNDPTPTFTFSSADEPGTTYECRVDGGAWVTCSGPRTEPPLADGPHTFEVRATDSAGNQDGSPASQTITVDTTPPQTAIVTGPSGTITEPNPTFTFSTTEPGSTYQCRVDGGAWVTCDATFNPGNLPNGPHTLEVRSIDQAGNQDGSPDQRQFTIDIPTTQPPSNPPADTQTELSGSLLSATSCQQLGTGARSAKRRIPGVGAVTVQLTSDSTILSAAPLVITTRAPRARTRSVRYTLDNVPLRGANRALGWAQNVTPSQLSSRSQHSLVVQVKGRGRPTRFTIAFATLRCDAALSAQLKRKGRASEIAMRVDSRSPASAVTFTAPSKYIPRPRGSFPAGALEYPDAHGRHGLPAQVLERQAGRCSGRHAAHPLGRHGEHHRPPRGNRHRHPDAQVEGQEAQAFPQADPRDRSRHRGPDVFADHADARSRSSASSTK